MPAKWVLVYCYYSTNGVVSSQQCLYVRNLKWASDCLELSVVAKCYRNCIGDEVVSLEFICQNKTAV